MVIHLRQMRSSFYLRISQQALTIRYQPRVLTVTSPEFFRSWSWTRIITANLQFPKITLDVSTVFDIVSIAIDFCRNVLNVWQSLVVSISKRASTIQSQRLYVLGRQQVDLNEDQSRGVLSLSENRARTCELMIQLWKLRRKHHRNKFFWIDGDISNSQRSCPKPILRLITKYLTEFEKEVLTARWPPDKTVDTDRGRTAFHVHMETNEKIPLARYHYGRNSQFFVAWIPGQTTNDAPEPAICKFSVYNGLVIERETNSHGY